MAFEIKETDIADLVIVNPFYANDDRGWFLKGFEKDVYKKLGLDYELNETFITKSKKNVIRGLHFQTREPQSKLVSVITGEIYDVAVDLRKNSKTYGKWHAEILSEENHAHYFIPKGFAHGFLVLSEEAIVMYQCSGKYDKETDTGIIWNDKTLNIEWLGVENAIISKKDIDLQTFKNFISNE